jgi:hypothetical protein
MRTLYIVSLMLISVSLFACNGNKKEIVEQNISNGDTMKLKITAGEKVLTATLYDNPASKDLVSLLPLTLTLTDYNNTEKISDLPRRLSTKEAPAGYKPSAGDLTIYAPWGNLAIFYKDFGYSNGLVVLGKLDSGVEVFNMPGSINVKIELNR